MHYTLVYDISQTGYPNWSMMLPSLTLIFGMSIFVFIYNRKKAGTLTLRDRLTPLIVVAFGLLFSGAWYLNYSDYKEKVDAVRRGDYRTIEGTVRQFVSEEKSESFFIGDKKFSYSQYDRTKGFNKTQFKGGPIREGLQVRIGYIDESIVRLEISE